MAFLIIFSSAALAGLIMILLNMTRLFQEAKKMGFPILFSPFGPLNPLFAFFPDQMINGFNAIPFGLGYFVNYSSLACSFKNRFKLHERYGLMFVVVTPFNVVLHVADATTADDILSKRKDFIKPPEMYEPLELFGRNVDTLNGDEWQRHRRITTPPFNERNSNYVWKESLRQTGDMLKKWMRSEKKGVKKVQKDTLTLALHVLTSAGFGKTYDFEDGVTKLIGQHKMSYKDALRDVLGHVFLSIIISSLRLPDLLLPKKLEHVKSAMKEFKQYMVEMVEEERLAYKKSDTEKDNLMSILIRASDSENQQRNGLTLDEIYGTIFIYNLAGHETTANTLAYAITLIAANRKLQRWIREELEAVLGESDSIEDWAYENAFPKLTRCIALMHETLRLYGPIVTIPKCTTDAPGNTILSDLAEETNLVIPPRTFVSINIAALHTSPEHWGPTALDWDPTRWIPKPSVPGREKLFHPTPGSYLPWASGPRVCPGKKFGQVEFVAVIARLFKKNEANVKLEAGEDEQAAARRVLACVEDSGLVVTLQMRHPERVGIIWEELSDA